VIRFVIVHHHANELQLVAVVELERRRPAGGAAPDRLIEADASAARAAARPQRLEPRAKARLRTERFVAQRLEARGERGGADAAQQPHAHVELAHPAAGRVPARRGDQRPRDAGLVHPESSFRNRFARGMRRRKSCGAECAGAGPARAARDRSHSEQAVCRSRYGPL
jgi:hypothetical protein